MITTIGLIFTSGLFWAQAAVGNTNVWLLLGLFSVQQAFFAINQPTRSAVLPKLLPPELLPAGNSLNITVFQAGAIAGPLVAGALIPVLGFSWLYAIDTVSLVATLVAVVRLPRLPVEGIRTAPGLRSVIDGFRYLRGHPVLMMSFLVDIIAMVFGMPRALFPEMAHTSFGGPEEGGLAFALLFAAIPAGAVLGGIFSGWVSRVERQGRAVIWAIIVWGLAITLFGVAAGLAGGSAGVMLGVAVRCWSIGGAADMVSSAFRNSMLHDGGHATRSVAGCRASSSWWSRAGPAVADVAHGSAAALVGTSAAAAGGGVLVVIGTVIAALAVPAFVRYRLPRSPVR